MKTLGKLKINSEKLLKNQELINLKGGYGDPIQCNGVTCSGKCSGSWTCIDNQCTCNYE